jgi:hypothetical protein
MWPIISWWVLIYSQRDRLLFLIIGTNVLLKYPADVTQIVSYFKKSNSYGNNVYLMLSEKKNYYKIYII